MKIDMVDIKKAVKMGDLNFYVKNNEIYCTNKTNEVVKVGEVDE